MSGAQSGDCMVKIKVKKSKNVLFWIIFIVVIAGGLWYYYKEPAAKPSATAPAPVTTGVQKGDLVSMNFALAMSNGSIVDTNNEAIAKEYNITTFSKGPFRFIVGQSGKVKGFDDALIGVEPGQNFTRIIPPSEQVLKLLVNRTRHISRNMPIPRYQSFSQSAFKKYFNKTAVINEVVYNPYFPWAYKVVNISDTNHIVCDPVVQEGKSYKLPSLEWNSTLLAATDIDMVFRHNPVDGQTIHTELGEAVVKLDVGVINVTYKAKIGDIVKEAVQIEQGGELVVPTTFEVTEANENHFLVTRINYLPQETLILKGEITDWTQDVKEVKPGLNVKSTPVMG
jgi:hypothetical protein